MLIQRSSIHHINVHEIRLPDVWKIPFINGPFLTLKKQKKITLKLSFKNRKKWGTPCMLGGCKKITFALPILNVV